MYFSYTMTAGKGNLGIIRWSWAFLPESFEYDDGMAGLL